MEVLGLFKIFVSEFVTVSKLTSTSMLRIQDTF